MKNSHSHPRRGRLKKYFAALLLPLLLLLTACDINTYVKLHENNTADVVTEMKLTKAELEMFSLGSEEAPTCDDLMEDTTVNAGRDYVIEDLSADGNLHCKATAKNQPLNQVGTDNNATITNENGIYTVELKGDESFDSGLLGLTGTAFNINMIYEFPGSVIEASAGTVEGNKVTINDISVIKDGLLIKAYSTQQMVLAPWAWWLIIGGAVLLVAGLIFWLVRRSKKEPAQPGHPQPYGAPQQNQYGQQPHQDQQPQQAWAPQQPSQPQAYGQQQWQQPHGQHPAPSQQPGQQPHPQAQQPWQPPQQAQPWQQGQPGQQPPHPQHGQQHPGQSGPYGVQGQQPQPPRHGEQPPQGTDRPGTGE